MKLITRKDALLAGGMLIVAFSLGRAETRAAAAATAKPEALDQVDSFLAIDGNGNVTIYSGKVDLGTGVRTALAQIAADELDVPFERITIVQGDTALTPDQGITYGSLSIQSGGMQIRQACATARQALVQEASQRLGVAAAQLTTQNGVLAAPSGKQVSYADLVGGREFSLVVDKNAPLKKPSAYGIVGKPIPRLDIPGKVTGSYTYVQDFRLPGMLYGRPVRPAAMGAALLDVDESSVRGIPGIVKVVRNGNFLGVVAETEWAAIRAARQLRGRWSNWADLPDERDLWSYVRATKITKDDVTSNVGDVAGTLAGAHKTLKATYDFAIHTHGSIGPSAAVAEFKDEKLTVWTASQGTHQLRAQLAAMLGMDAANVRCVYVAGSGCYGRNGHEDAAADAALLARAVGHPVRVQWMRWDEHGWDPKGPPTLVDLQAGIDASGNVVAWRGDFFIPVGAGAPVWLLPGQLAGLPAKESPQPGNVVKDSDIPYDFPNMLTTCHRLEATPFRPSWIRSPGRMQNTFANESFLDEIVAALGADPLEYRLAHLKDARAADLLHRVAALAKWQPHEWGSRGSGATMRGRGLSFVHYEMVRTYVAAIADVAVDRKSGKVRVERVAIAHDCGQIINPDGLRNQIEGCVVQTVSRTLLEELKFNRSRVTSLDWSTYPILRFPDVPDVAIDLIDRPESPPWGAGEPAAAVVPAAICNAIFDATGARLRSVPFTPAKVKAALT